jgi:hypothetical protein
MLGIHGYSWFCTLMQVIRLARKLPTGDLQAIKKSDDGEESLDEDDLT